MILAGIAILLVTLQPPPGAASRSPPSAEASPALPAELADLDARIAGIADLRADFEQRKHTPLLKKPLVSSGTVLVRDDRVRWDTHKPRRSSMAIGTGEIRIHYPDERIVEVYPLRGEMRALAGSPLPRLAALGDRFEVRAIDPAVFGAPPRPGRRVAAELLPRHDELKQVVGSVLVLFDADVPCVTHIVMTDPDGETTEIEFRSVGINTGVPEAAMTLVTPADTREVRPLGAGSPEPVR